MFFQAIQNQTEKIVMTYVTEQKTKRNQNFYKNTTVNETLSRTFSNIKSQTLNHIIIQI